jgi:hypothetical protein
MDGVAAVIALASDEPIELAARLVREVPDRPRWVALTFPAWRRGRPFGPATGEGVISVIVSADGRAESVWFDVERHPLRVAEPVRGPGMGGRVQTMLAEALTEAASQVAIAPASDPEPTF